MDGWRATDSGTSAAFLERCGRTAVGDLGQRAGAPRGGGACCGRLASAASNLPAYSPDFNADEAIWGWVREEATGNLCLGTKSMVQERVGNFFASLASRKEEVKRRCRTVLQSRAEGLLRDPQPPSQPTANAHPTLALV